MNKRKLKKKIKREKRRGGGKGRRRDLWGDSRATEKESSSFIINNPAARIGICMPIFDECERCAVPNASWT